MTDRGARRPVLALLLAAAAFSACNFDMRSAEPNDPRLLDRACTAGRCETTGYAQETTGITSDSIGFRISGGAGSVKIPMESRAQPDFVLELLVSGHGSVTVGISEAKLSQSFALGQDYRWVSVSGTVPAGTSSGSSQGDLTLVLSVSDSSSSLELADLRASGLDYAGACSVVAVGRR